MGRSIGCVPRFDSGAIFARHLPAQQPADAAIHILPAASVAFVVYGGSYDDFGAVGSLHVAVRDWLEARGARWSAHPCASSISSHPPHPTTAPV
jgi:hypothetical protein